MNRKRIKQLTEESNALVIARKKAPKMEAEKTTKPLEQPTLFFEELENVSKTAQQIVAAMNDEMSREGAITASPLVIRRKKIKTIHATTGIEKFLDANPNFAQKVPFCKTKRKNCFAKR